MKPIRAPLLVNLYQETHQQLGGEHFTNPYGWHSDCVAPDCQRESDMSGLRGAGILCQDRVVRIERGLIARVVYDSTAEAERAGAMQASVRRWRISSRIGCNEGVSGLVAHPVPATAPATFRGNGHTACNG